ncbi:MAG: hypothetical protein GC164_16680 [Phycisphaera sp.]|nr:hypothetical protein [Phycisphaera sp.]
MAVGIWLVIVVVFSLLGLIPLTLVIWLLVYAARSATVQVGRCAGCGYDLAHLGESRACPECGLAFTRNARGDAVSKRSA